MNEADATASTGARLDRGLGLDGSDLRIWAALVGLFCVLHLHRLSGYFLSIDDEYAVLRNSYQVWVEQGRWGMYLFQRFVLPQPAVPFLPLFVFGSFLAAAYLGFLRGLGVARPRTIHYLAFPLFCTSPAWTMLAYFSANIAAAGPAMLCIGLAAWGLRTLLRAEGAAPMPWPRRTGTTLACAALGALAISTYQSFVLSLAACGVCVAIAQAWQERIGLGRFAAHLLHLGAIVALSVALYWVVQRLFLQALGIASMPYLDKFIHMDLLQEQPATVLRAAMDQVLQVYGGDGAIYARGAFGVGLVVFLGLLGVVRSARSTGMRAALLATAVGLLLLPFAQNLVNGGDMPPRTLIAVPPLLSFLAMLALGAREVWLARAAVVACLLATVQILNGSVAMHAAGELARRHDEALAAALYARIHAANPNIDATGLIRVDLYGGLKFDSVFPRPAWSTPGYSFFEWGGGDETRMLLYMRLLGYSDLQPADAAQHRRDLPVLRTMPLWPADGSVVLRENTVLVRLGTAAGAGADLP